MVDFRVFQHVAHRLIDQADRPLKHGAAVHPHEVFAGLDGFAGGGLARAAGLHVQNFFAPSRRRQGVGDQTLVFAAGGQQHRSGAVAEQRISFVVARLDDARIGIGADDQCQLAASGGDELRTVTRAYMNPAQAAETSNAAAMQAEFVLHLRGGRGDGQVGAKVPRTNRSTSPGETPARSMAAWRAATAKSLVHRCRAAVCAARGCRCAENPLRIAAVLGEVFVAHTVSGT